MSSQSLNLKAAGLSIHSNPLSSVPPGSMSDAVNVVIDRNEIVESRRGFSQYGNSFGVLTDRTKQLFTYKDVVLRHVLSKLQFDSNNSGLFLDIAGQTITEVESGLRIKAIEANGNFYFTSATGIKKVSARNLNDLFTQSIQDAGGVKALDISVQLDFSALGFLEANSKVAYKVLFGINDLNENLILGSPSSRTVIYNISATACITKLTFALPSDVTDSHFYQIYRTGVTSAVSPTEPGDPGEEMNLVFEENITSADITAGSITINDITPEDFRRNGTLLYNNPVSGEGILQSNEKPPFAKDISSYKGYTFYANTKTVQRLNLSVLSVQNMVNNVSNFIVSDGVTTTTYLVQGSIETFTADYTGTLITDYYNGVSGPAKYFSPTSANDERSYYIWYYQSPFDLDPLVAGKIGIKVTILNSDSIPQLITKTVNEVLLQTDDFNLSVAGTILTLACSNNGPVATVPTETIGNPSFTIVKNGLGTGEDIPGKKIFLPRVPGLNDNGPTTALQLEQFATSLVKVINSEDPLISAYYISGFNDVPGQVLFERRITTGSAFYLNSNVGAQYTPTLPVSGSNVVSSNEIRPNRVYYSKFQQPEAVPLPNYFDVGPKDREIKRIVALSDSLFIFKEDGIYRVSGDSAPFVVTPFDFSSQVLAPDSVVVLNNQIYALSIQGVVLITEAGVQVISRPIETALLSIIKNGNSYKSISFGVSYETDRSYLLWLPTFASDTVATQAFRYNSFTNTWTKWSKTQTCGIVNFADDKLYLGAGDLNIVEKERKSLTRTDHADREYEVEIQLRGVVNNTLELNSVNNITTGDVLIQKQYLTSTQFNRLLEKLDDDITVVDNNYLATLKYLPGLNMRSALSDLAIKLDLDPGLVFTNYLSLIDNYSYNITNISVAPQSVLTIGAHQLEIGRYVTISGSNSTPAIDGIFEVIAITATTITINKEVLLSGNTGSLQTEVNDFRDMQACYNLITTNLNNDDGAFFSNYPVSEDSVEFETVILSKNTQTNTITIKNPQQFLFGLATTYKAIRSSVTYNPQFFGDPSIEKQISECTYMFQDRNFSLFTAAFSSDRSPSFVNVLFEGAGIGDFGQFNFGARNFGGVSSPIPLRTYIPLEKQRCRFINVKYEHAVAFEKYALFGISLKFRPYNTRTTK
jgi:hypothetical protein